MTCKQSPDVSATTGNTTDSIATRPCEPSGTVLPGPAIRMKRTTDGPTAAPFTQPPPRGPSCPFIALLGGKHDGANNRDADLDCEGCDAAPTAAVAAVETPPFPATFAPRRPRSPRPAETVLPRLAGSAGTPPARSPGLPAGSVSRCCRCRVDSGGSGGVGGGRGVGGGGDNANICGGATNLAMNVDDGFARAAAAAIAAARPTRYTRSSTRINRS